MEIERYERQFNSLTDDALAKAFQSRSELCPEAQAALMAVAYSRGLTPEKLEKIDNSQPTPKESFIKSGKTLVRKIFIFFLFLPLLIIGGGINGLIQHHINAGQADRLAVVITIIFVSSIVLIALAYNKGVDLLTYLKNRKP